MKKDSDLLFKLLKCNTVDNNVVLYCNISIITLFKRNNRKLNTRKLIENINKINNKQNIKMLQELVTLMLGNKYKTGLCPCTCWWLRRNLRKTWRLFFFVFCCGSFARNLRKTWLFFFFSFSEIRLLNSGVMPCVLKQRHADWILTL